MQSEKQYLIDEVGSYLDRGEYCVLTDFTGITVEQTEIFRGRLSKLSAEFHVVKNRIFKRAAQDRAITGLDDWLKGQTGIIVGGDRIADIIKEIEKFNKESDKVAIKGGILGKQAITPSQVSELVSMPSKEQLQAQLLALLNTPGTQLVRLLNTPGQQMVTVLNGVPQAILNVLKQRSLQEN